MSSIVAWPADALVDSIGVNSRFAEVKAKLGALSVRHLRDGSDERVEVARNVRDVCQSFGIRVLQGVGGPSDDAAHADTFALRPPKS